MCPVPDQQPDPPDDPDLADLTQPPGRTDGRVDGRAGVAGDHRQAVVLHRHPGFVALVFAGGVLGTAGRAVLTDVLAPRGGLGNAGATLLINLAGCLLLGFLLEALARCGPDRGRRRLLRLGVGTGFCGGFTTYSTLALDAATDVRGGDPGSGLGYAGLSLVLGLAVTALGVLVGSRVVRSHSEDGTR